jgi:hypothetical protein
MSEEERRKIITGFISRHQGCKAEEVVDGIKDRISRVPFFNTLKILIEEGIVKDDASNRRDHKLYVDEKNLLVSVPRELQDFEEAFVNLLQKSKKKTTEKDFTQLAKKLGIPESNPSKWNESEIIKYQEFEMKNLAESIEKSQKVVERLNIQNDRVETRATNLEQLFQKIAQMSSVSKSDFVHLGQQLAYQRSLLIESRSETENAVSSMKDLSSRMDIDTLNRGAVIIFYSMIDVILFRSTVVWPALINDKETLRKLYGITYSKVAEIQLQLSKFLRSSQLFPISNPVEFIAELKGSRHRLSTYLLFYWGANMQEEIGPVIHCISNISVEIKKYGYDPKIDWPPSLFRSFKLIEENIKWCERIDAILQRRKETIGLPNSN